MKKLGREEKKGKYNIKRNRERVRFLLGKGKNCKKPGREEKKGIGREKEFDFYWGRGKTVKKTRKRRKERKIQWHYDMILNCYD